MFWLRVHSDTVMELWRPTTRAISAQLETAHAAESGYAVPGVHRAWGGGGVGGGAGGGGPGGGGRGFLLHGYSWWHSAKDTLSCVPPGSGIHLPWAPSVLQVYFIGAQLWWHAADVFPTAAFTHWPCVQA